MSTQSGPGLPGPNHQQPGPFQPQGQQAYQTGGSQVAPPVQGTRRNTLAIVAVALAVVGAVFAVIEGAYIIGWVLLPPAFILSIVALVVRDKPRKLAVTALVVSIVGTIAGMVAFAGSAARAIDESLTGGEASVVATEDEPTEAVESAAGEASTEAAQDVAADEGTREAPYPLGTTVANDDWEVTVNSFTPDATAEVMAENQFNDEPADGAAYALVNVTVTRVAAESGTPWEVSVAFVTDGGNVVTGTEGIAVGPDELPIDELYEGGSVTGNVVVEIPADGAGTVRVTPGLFADDVFFATS